MPKTPSTLNARLAASVLVATLPALAGVMLGLGYVAGQWALASVAAAVVAILSTSAGWIIARRLIAPLAALTHAAQQVAAGRTGHMVVAGRGHDEICQLADAFNSMILELQRSHRTIEQQVEGRIHQLRRRNRELEQACELAEQERGFKDEFLANMSHEIRTPLTAIIGYAELLVDMAMPEQERLKAMQSIQYNGQHLLNVINDVLDVAKLDAKKMEVENVEFAPVQLLNDVLTLMRPKAQEKGLKLGVEFATRLPELIQTDPTRLRQIVLNLIGNAIKFTHTGSVRLVVKLIEAGDGQESFLQFSVIDTGIGIDAEHIGKLFQPFTQGCASRSREYGGSGLGLVISQRLARLLGGDITVASQFGEGSTFTATVRIGAVRGARLTNPSLLPGDSVAAYSFMEDECALELKGVRVLVADDTPQNRDLVGKMLRSAGAQVEVADNGRLACHRAMEAFQARAPFHVVLMDIQMPELDGYEATRKLRGLGYPGTIIALTASASDTQRHTCIEAGCNDFARKPIERKKLIELIARWVKTSRAPRPATHAA